MIIEVDKQSGIMEIKQVLNGIEYKKKYMGYSEKEAVKKFNEFIKKKNEKSSKKN